MVAESDDTANISARDIENSIRLGVHNLVFGALLEVRLCAFMSTMLRLGRGDARTIVGKKRWGYGRWLGCALIVDAYGFIRRKHVVRSMSP
jgi:hypothetical protein